MADSSIRILAVDDDRLLLTVIVSLIRREGYENVEIARNGVEALKRFPVMKPHIVFLDIEMPEMDGIAVLNAIREYGITTQVVMVSATATAERVEAAKAGGAAGFIVKPISQKRIGDAIRVCRKRASQVEGDIELFLM